jgi:hypothetical protein
MSKNHVKGTGLTVQDAEQKLHQDYQVVLIQQSKDGRKQIKMSGTVTSRFSKKTGHN